MEVQRPLDRIVSPAKVAPFNPFISWQLANESWSAEGIAFSGRYGDHAAAVLNSAKS